MNNPNQATFLTRNNLDKNMTSQIDTFKFIITLMYILNHRIFHIIRLIEKVNI